MDDCWQQLQDDIGIFTEKTFPGASARSKAPDGSPPTMADRPRLPASLTRKPAEVAAAMGRQALREWRAGPLHQLQIGQPKTDREVAEVLA